MRRSHLVAVLAMAVFAQACSGSDAGDQDQPTTAATTPTAAASSPAAATEAAATPTAPATPTVAPVDALDDSELSALAVNEIGRVMVSEWHIIGADADGDYSNTLETFRSQLQYLYDHDLRPVTAAEYADSSFPIPAGTAPVVLTFDDSSPNHFAWAADGVTPDPDSVVGILEEFAATHDDWRATAVFAINWPPFGTTDPDAIQAKLQYLVDNGYEISNHTMTHDNLSDLDAQAAQDEIAGIVANVQELVPDAPVATLTLPFGIRPTDDALAVDGTGSDGTTYHHDLVFEVGWQPDSSPNHVDYDPESVMRVPAHGPWGPDDLDWWDWVDWLDNEPNRKFISDGDPTTVTYPVGFQDVAAVPEGMTARTYGADAAGSTN